MSVESCYQMLVNVENSAGQGHSPVGIMSSHTYLGGIAKKAQHSSILFLVT